MASFSSVVEHSRQLVARSARLQVQAAGLVNDVICGGDVRARSRAVCGESRRLRRFAAWHYRLRIRGAQGDTVAREVIDQLDGAPVCARCVAAQLRLPLLSVQHVIGELRRAFAVDTIRGCRQCGGPALTLHRNGADEAAPRTISTDDPGTYALGRGSGAREVMTAARRMIRGASGLPVERSDAPRIPMRALLEELQDGPLCVKCLATNRGFTRFEVERTLGELRGEIVLDSIIPCRGCGASKSLSLQGPRRQPHLFVIAPSPRPSSPSS